MHVFTGICGKALQKKRFLIKKLLSGCYDISVRNCSREENTDGEIRVKRLAENQSAVISKTGMLDKRYIWHVGIINAFGFVKTDEWGN